jgi:beta-galactosidase
MVHFKLTGDAKIIGVGNGDPSSHEADKCTDGAWQRSAFNGKCQVIIQAGNTVGDVKLEVKSNGLLSTLVEINQN